MKNPLLDKLRAGRCIGAVWTALGSPTIAELMVLGEPDCIVFDLQHGLWTRPNLEYAIGMTRDRTVPLCRVQDDSYSAIGSALDAGAAGVIVPVVESAEQASLIVAAAKYPPEGRRSCGGIRPVLDAKAQVPAANAGILVCAMIETAAGVENAAEIAAVPGIDMIFIGPFDLALSLQTFPDFGPKHQAAVDTVKTACKSAKKPCGIFTPYASMAADRRAQGFQMVALTYDQDLVQAPSKAAIKLFSGTSGNDLIQDATALVTGCSRGIGPKIAEALLHAGAAKVYCAARNIDDLGDLITTDPGRLIPRQLDITSADQVAAAAKQCEDVTLLINNAGVNFNTPLFAIDETANARHEMEVNYFGTLAMCRAFQPVLKRNGGGAIVNMLSILAKVNLPLMGSLCASKAAALSMTQALRAELKGQGTHVMAVLPGAVDTEMTKDFQGPKIPPRLVAEAIVDGLKHRMEEVYPGDMGAGVAYGLSSDAKAVEHEFANYLPERRL